MAHGKPKKPREVQKLYRPVDDDDVIAILDDVGNDLPIGQDAKHWLRYGINQAVERRNQMHMGSQGNLPHVHIAHLVAMQKAATDLFAVLDAIPTVSYVSLEIAYAAEWVETQWPTDEINVGYGATQLARPIPHRPGRDQRAASHEDYLVARSKMWQPSPPAMLAVRSDQDRIARIHLAAKLAAARARQDQAMEKRQPKLHAMLRYEFMHNLAYWYEMLFKHRPATSEEGRWLRFLASVMSRVECKSLSPPGARSLWQRAAAAHELVGTQLRAMTEQYRALVSLHKKKTKRNF